MPRCLRGKNSPRWRGGPVKRKCNCCGKSFYVDRNVVKKGWGKHCSYRCRQRMTMGEKAPNWRGGSIKCTCEICSKIFYASLSRVKRYPTKCCSMECRRVYQSIHFQGKKGNNWRGGPARRKCKCCGNIFYIPHCVIKAGNGNFCSMRCGRLSHAIPVKDTLPERILQKVLKKNRIIFEKHKAILGQPDLFVKPNICIFADGDYWHRLPGRQKRDKYVTQELTKQGYKVLRFWECDIKRSVQKCLNKILITVDKNVG